MAERGVRASSRSPLRDDECDLAAAQARIMRADELIDQIVYRLYGLTEKEIGLAAEVAAWPDLREVGIRFSS